MTANSRAQVVIPLIAAIWILWGFGYQTLWQRLTIQLDGVIVSSRDVPAKGAPRYATEYVVRDANGQEHRYIAGATDASLERSMPAGTRIRKGWGRLGYEADGRWIEFPVAAYSAMLGIAFACLFWAAHRLWTARKRADAT